jgi:hypothetical protein
MPQESPRTSSWKWSISFKPQAKNIMKKVIITSLFLAASLLPGAAIAQFAAGANNIASATTAALGNSNTTDIFNFNTETGEPSHDFYNGNNGLRSAWWKWTATESGLCTVDTLLTSTYVPLNALRDSTVAVYVPLSTTIPIAVTNLRHLASNNNFGQYFDSSDYALSRASFYAVSGTTYYIAVDGGWSGAVTNIARNVVLRLRQLPALALTRRGLWTIDTQVLGKRGSLTLTTTSTGSYTATLMIGATRHLVVGQFDPDGTSTRSIRRPTPLGSVPLLPITLKIDGSQDAYFELFLDGQTIRQSLPRQAVFSKTSPSALAATYNIASRTMGSSQDPGRGYLRTTVSPTGAVAMVGVTRDGARVTAASALCLTNDADEYEAPAYTLLHANKGSAQFYGYFSDYSGTTPDECSVEVDSIRPAATSATATFYPSGHYSSDFMEGIPYVKPAAASRVLNFLNASSGQGTLSLYDSTGEMATTVQEGLTLSTANKVSFISAVRKPTLTVNTTTGIVTGSITTTDTILGVTKPRVRKLTGLIFNDINTPSTVYLTGQASGVTKNLMFDVTPALVVP